MLPLATTTVTVKRPADGDPYVTASSTTASSGTPAHIGQPSGSEVQRGGEQESITDVLLADASLDVRHTDLIVDETTGTEYRVQWVRLRQGLGLDHVRAGLVTHQGAAVGA